MAVQVLTNCYAKHGSTVMTDHIPRNGKSVRAVSQASGTAMATEAPVTATTRTTERIRISNVRKRNNRSHTSVPAPKVRKMR